MEDLDDSDATKVIVAAVESSRLGKLEFNPEIVCSTLVLPSLNY